MINRPEWWIRKEGVYGVKRFVSDRIMQRWENDERLKWAVKYYIPACSHCPVNMLRNEK